MAVCPAYANPSRTRRTLCLVAIEQTPGCTVTILSNAVAGATSAGLAQTTLYENFNPLAAEFDTVQMNRARTGLGPEGFAIGIGTFRFTGSVYVVGSGYSNLSPVWAKVLQACGWWEERYVSDTGPETLTGLTLTDSTGGNMTAEKDYVYGFTLVDATTNKRESRLVVDPALCIVTTAAGNGTVTIDWSAVTALKPSGADRIRIYRSVGVTTPADGSEKLYFLADMDDPNTVTSYIDTISDSQLGEEAPVPISIKAVTDVTGTAANGGYMENSGTYNYKFVLVSPIGTTLKVSPATSGLNTGASDESIELDWTANTEMYRAGYDIKIYRTDKTGASSYKYVATVDGEDGTYLDTLADASRTTVLPSDPTLTGDQIRWIPLNEQHKSLSFKNMLDGISYVASGVRGTMNFAADTGQPMRGDVDLQGSYNDGVIGANIGALANPGIPPRLLDISCYMYDSAGVTYSGLGTAGHKKLIVKNIGVNLGTQVSRRTDAQTESGLIEYGIFAEYQPRITMQVEVLNDASHTVDFLKKFKDGVKFYIEFTVSNSGTEATTEYGTHVTFYTAHSVSSGTVPGANDIVPVAASYNSQLATPPTFGDVENVRTWNLEFVPGGSDTENVVADNFLMLRHW